MSCQNTTTRSFNQSVKGNVIVTKIKSKKYMYRIQFNTNTDFIVIESNQNNNTVITVPAKEWVHTFNEENKYLIKQGNKPLALTTIMETTSDGQYVFNIHKARVDKVNRLIFLISTKEIQLSNNVSKKTTQIPSKYFKNAQFISILRHSDDNNIIDGVPQGTTEYLTSCWRTNQLYWHQQASLKDKFYSRRPGNLSGFGMRNDNNGKDGWWYAYTCRSYGWCREGDC
jgi:PHD/YefM family antitoxin component YafN of YafNO toxin-antitoxin module